MAFEEYLLGNQLAMEFVEGDRLESHIKYSDHILKFQTDISEDYSIELSLGESSARGGQFINKEFRFEEVLSDSQVMLFEFLKFNGDLQLAIL